MNDQSTHRPDNNAEGDKVRNETAPEGLLSGKTTQLAMGAAATIGIMILYKLRAKLLAKEDPESYAQVREITAAVREAERIERTGDRRGRQASDRRISHRQKDRREGERRDPDQPNADPDLGTV